jgi:hypothetical protein
VYFGLFNLIKITTINYDNKFSNETKYIEQKIKKFQEFKSKLIRFIHAIYFVYLFMK